MQKNQQNNSKEQHEKRNPEVAVCNYGFEHNCSLRCESLVFPW